MALVVKVPEWWIQVLILTVKRGYMPALTERY